MKAILISIKPKWVAKILNGEKTIEIRKTMPKCDLPIDVYIYCTKDKPRAIMTDKGCVVANTLEVGGNSQYKSAYSLSGKVVAKFTLDKVGEIKFDDKEVQRKACLTEDELFEYLFVNEPYHEDMKKGYAWHISNLVIFDKPKELSEFKIPCDFKCPKLGCCYCHKNTRLTKAPQSWCYVEVEVDE